MSNRMSTSFGAILRQSRRNLVTFTTSTSSSHGANFLEIGGITKSYGIIGSRSLEYLTFRNGSRIYGTDMLGTNPWSRLNLYPSISAVLGYCTYHQRRQFHTKPKLKSLLLKNTGSQNPRSLFSTKVDGPVKVRNPRPKGIVPFGEDYGGYNEEKHEEYEKEAEQRQIRIRWLKKVFSSLVFVSVLVSVMWARNRKQRTVNENTKNAVFLPKDFLFSGSFNTFCVVESPSGGESCVLQSEMVKDGTLRFIQSMELRQGDVVVASFPKTGTTWVQEIAYLIQNNLDFNKAGSNLLEDRFPFLEYPYPGARSVDKMESPRMIKTHLPFSFLPKNSDRAKIIYCTRNPKDTVVSFYHFARMLSFTGFTGSFDEFLERFIDDKIPYTPFFGHVESYLAHKDSPNILIVSYEELSQDPVTVIHKIASFLEKPLTVEEATKIMEHTTFQAMSSNPSVNYKHWDDLGFRKKDEAQFLRKGKVGDWKNYFSRETNAQFERWITENNKLNIKFKYD